MIKLKKGILIGLVAASILIPEKDIFALEYIKSNNFVCTETEEYKNWASLPKEERNKYIEPVRCLEFYTDGGSKYNNKLGSIQNVDYTTLRKFDLRDVNGQNYISAVGNQGDTELCWTFAATSSIESAYKIENAESINISKKHIAFNTTYKLGETYFNPFGDYGRESWTEPGNYFVVGEYLSEGRGPVLESKVPWSTVTPTLELATTKADYYVNNVLFYLSNNSGYNENDIKTIKELITNYGSVSTTMFAGNILSPTDDFLASDGESYYVKSAGFSGANHGVSIIGWDDDYPKEKFDAENGMPEGNGAWLIKNSWGESFGNNGYFWISYYDKFISTNVMAVSGVENEVSDNNYFYDTVGSALDFFKTSHDKVIFKEKFEKKNISNELLEKISFFIVNNLSYNFYYSEVDDFTKAQKIGEYSGNKIEYATIKLNKPINISSDSFYIYVEATSNLKTCLNDASLCRGDDIGYAYYIEKFRTYETEDSNEKKIVYKPSSILATGVSYYSFDGNTWIESISNDKASFYPVIHAFTSTLDYTLEINNINKSAPNLNLVDGGYFEISLNTDNVNEENLLVKVLNSKNENVINNFEKTDIENGYRFTITDDTIKGKYRVELTYKKLKVTSEEISIAKNNDTLISSIEISGGNEVSVNGTLNLSATVKPDDATNKNVIWESSNNNIATVNENGIVTGIKSGKVIITVKATDESETSKSVEITVIDINKEEGNGITPSYQDKNISATKNPKTGLSDISIYLVGSIAVFGAAYLIIRKKSIFKKI